MAFEGSVTGWLGLLQEGDRTAAQQLWERYFQRLVGLARKKLGDASRRVADEEDVALSAFDTFCRHAEEGRFPQLQDRESLWRLLVVITARKATHQIRDEERLKRGGGLVRQTGAPGDDAEDHLLDQVVSREPSPDFAAEVADECRRLLALLNDPELEAVALGKMEGFSVEEIAARTGFAPRSVKRKLQMIRTLWEKELAS